MADEFGGANVGFGQGNNPLGYFGRLLNDLTGKTSSNQFNAVEAEKARLFNSAEAEKQRDWETMMSNTSYQRAAADMRAAGINPASLGGNAAASGASTPSGASASGVAARDGSGNGSVLGSVIASIIGGIGTAAKNSIARSALSTKNGYLDLKQIETNSRIALNAAKQVDHEVTSANKEFDRKWKEEKWNNHLKKLGAEKSRHEEASNISDEEIDALFDDLGFKESYYKPKKRFG